MIAKVLLNKYTIGLFLILLIAIFFKMWMSERSVRKEAERARDAANKDYQELNIKYVGAQGDLITKTKTIQLNESNFKKAFEANELKWVNKFNKTKDVASAITFSTGLKTETIKYDTVYIPCKDSLTVFLYTYKDAWNDIRAMVTELPTLEQRDRIYIVDKRERPKGWFWRFQWRKRVGYLEVTNSNTLISIDSVAHIRVTD
jgi:hypothetical protein